MILKIKLNTTLLDSQLSLKYCMLPIVHSFHDFYAIHYSLCKYKAKLKQVYLLPKNSFFERNLTFDNIQYIVVEFTN